MIEPDTHTSEMPKAKDSAQGPYDAQTSEENLRTGDEFIEESNSISADISDLPQSDTPEDRINPELEYGQPIEVVPPLTPNEKVIDAIAAEEAQQAPATNTAAGTVDQVNEAAAELSQDGFTGIAAIPEAEAYLELREKHDKREKLTEKDIDQIADLAVNYLRQILHCFGEDDAVINEFEGDDGELILEITGGDLAVLIGRHGNTLSALQQVLNSYISKHIGFRYSLFVDLDGYREKRKVTVINLANQAVKRALERQRDIELKPMNAYERRLVHITLKGNASVETYSRGEDPYRFVVVHPKRETANEDEQVGQSEETELGLA